MCGLQLPGLVATSEVRRSQDAFRRNDLDAAFAHVNQAVESAPWAATPYVQRGLLDESVGDLDAAFADLGGATARELGNWRHHLLLARLEAERGDVRAAIQEFRRTRELRPASLFAPPQP
jgi:tetratricopeptide (TPR) repeat protein